MRAGHPIVDADGHVVEPLDLWDRYIDDEFRDRRPVVDPQFITVEGSKMSRLGLPEPTRTTTSRSSTRGPATTGSRTSRSRLRRASPRRPTSR